MVERCESGYGMSINWNIINMLEYYKHVGILNIINMAFINFLFSYSSIRDMTGKRLIGRKGN